MNPKSWRTACCVAAIAAFGCAAEDGPAPTTSALSYTADEEPSFCDEPAEVDAPQSVIDAGHAPPPAQVRGERTRDGRVDFEGVGSGSITIAERIAPDDPRATEAVLTVGGRRVSITSAGSRSFLRADIALTTRDRTLASALLATTYRVDEGRLWVGEISVTGADGATHSAAPGGFAGEPATCGELALVRFGSIPNGMPSFTWPINVGCMGNDCTQARLAYVEAVHGTWRLTQMMNGLAELPSYQRSWAWNREGADAAGEAAGPRTSPRHWFGSYKDDRFDTIREAYNDHLNVLRTAHMDTTDLRLKCPSKEENPLNGCFSSTTWAHHSVKGWVNVCPRLWSTIESRVNGDDDAYVYWVNHVIAHEFWHHHYVDIHGVGWKMLKDTMNHHHGSLCLGVTLEGHEAIPGPPGIEWDTNLTHLSGYVNQHGDHCGHRRVLLRNVDTYNSAARLIGKRIRHGQLVQWPLPAPPTPQPPTCVGGEGCLCQDAVLAGRPPDGDFSPDEFCDDNDGRMECVRTQVNAGAIVGICHRCDTERGIGCDCNDFTMPCDVGSCWGDDTRGTSSGVGRCYDDPPDFACLVDCQRLFADDHAYCMTDHPVRARCMPPTVYDPEAWPCWEQGGHIGFEEECVMGPECGPGAAPLPGHSEGPTCGQLGYPPYFVCDTTNRCTPEV